MSDPPDLDEELLLLPELLPLLRLEELLLPDDHEELLPDDLPESELLPDPDDHEELLPDDLPESECLVLEPELF
jgi:hypothetical protein